MILTIIIKFDELLLIGCAVEHLAGSTRNISLSFVLFLGSTLLHMKICFILYLCLMAVLYSRAALLALNGLATSLLRPKLFCSLCNIGVSKTKLTRRGCHGRVRKIARTIPEMTSGHLPSNLSFTQDGKNLHNQTGSLLNIQVHTFDSLGQNVDILAISQIPVKIKTHHVPTVMLTNVMSLAPKIVKVQEFVYRNNVDLAFITETWLSECIDDSIVDIPGYTIIRRDRSTDNHSGVCLYIFINITFYQTSNVAIYTKCHGCTLLLHICQQVSQVWWPL